MRKEYVVLKTAANYEVFIDGRVSSFQNKQDATVFCGMMEQKLLDS